MGKSIDKGLKLLSLKSSDAAIPKSCNVGRIRVMGYDTGLPRNDVVRALRKHFSSCGEITDVYISINYNYHTLWKGGHIYFLGEGAVDKALQLNGSDVGGWNVTVKAHPFPTYANDSAILKVEGYDTSLRENEIKTHLTQLFSPYGKIEGVFSGNGSATVSVRGEDVAVKAPQLNGSDIGGRKLTVLLLNGGISTVHERRKYGHHCPCRHLGKKAKTTAE